MRHVVQNFKIDDFVLYSSTVSIQMWQKYIVDN